MHRCVLRCLAEMVEKRHGSAAWLQICHESGVSVVDGQLLHKPYSQQETATALHSACRTLDLCSESLLEQTGSYFLDFLKIHGYERFLVALGHNLQDFLSNLDLVYTHLEPFYPDMCPPLFRCVSSGDGSLLLYYLAEGEGSGAFVKGLVRTVAKQLFHVDVQMERLSMPASPKPDHRNSQSHQIEAFVIKDKKAAASLGCQKRRSLSFISSYSKLRISASPKDSTISERQWCKLFPFHLLIDRQLICIQVGDTMWRIIQDTLSPTCQNVKFTDVFHIQKPLVSLTFSSILSNINTTFSLQIKTNGTSPAGTFASNSRDTLVFRGEVIYIPESDCILLMCSPRVHELCSLAQFSLSLCDIPLHDMTRRLLLLSQSRRQGRELLRRLEETSCDLLRVQDQLQRERKKTDQLLFSMLPEHIALSLRRGERVKAERFEVASVLCSDIVNFTALCGHESVGPMDIIRVLNRLYTQFDELTSIHSVFKVETIGDAYLIVGGVPEYTTDHADRVVAMAFDMIDVCKTVISPADGITPIQVRLGIHSGECVAGVVGKKKPRYCLFGQTVSLASQMETLSLPSYVNITATTKSYLMKTTDYIFEVNDKDPQGSSFFVRRTTSNGLSQTSLGLPTKRGMFKTPNPTPPSSHDSSPATSPMWMDRMAACGINTMHQECGSMLTVPCVRPSGRLQSDFSFDFADIAVALPTHHLNSNNESNVFSCNEQNSFEEPPSISITVGQVPKLTLQKMDTHDGCTNIVESETLPYMRTSHATEQVCDKLSDTLPVVRPKVLQRTDSGVSRVETGQTVSHNSERNGMVRRSSDSLKSLYGGDLKLVCYFRQSKSMPPTPNTS